MYKLKVVLTEALCKRLLAPTVMALFDQLQESQTFVHYSSLSKQNLFSIITVGETRTDCDSLESFITKHSHERSTAAAELKKKRQKENE